jgi:ABC-type phosphate transport system substrate-binding protein
MNPKRLWPPQARRTPLSLLASLMLAGALPPATAWSAPDPAQALPAYHQQHAASLPLSSLGDAALQPLMEAWWAGFQRVQPQATRGRWQHGSDAAAMGALMFELADMAPLARDWTAAELAPYAHQFAGDMMKTPLMLRVATLQGRPAYIAVNKRPGAPLPPQVSEFLSYALSQDGQQAAARLPGFAALDAASAAAERDKLQGYLVPLDPALPLYRTGKPVAGEIRSVGSDGMKTLMDRWLREFRRLQPGVRPGAHWEHLGTLNGFHALLAGETDLAPMGRELWPVEAAAYQAVRGQPAPLEIRVARGGFNTPQRTTAQAIFTHANNPLRQITLAQLAAILGQPASITRWGQLGLGGEWADRPITVYTPPLAAPNAMSMQDMVLHGGAWTVQARPGSIADTAAAIARDPGAIGFGGFEEGGPGLQTMAVARDAAGPYLAGTPESAASGRYPLTRYMYIRLNRQPGQPLPAQTREFLRYILSRQGQEPIRYSGYFPLTAQEVKEELAKLN